VAALKPGRGERSAAPPGVREAAGAGAPGRVATRGSGPATWAVLGLLAVFLGASYPHALSLPFINDDYLILDKTIRQSLGSLWAPRDLLFNWYRPWSREFHYWTLRHLFGLNVKPYHLASFALWLADMTLFFTLARRLAGGATAALAAAATAALAAWAGSLLWVAGVQDLWMMLFAFLFLHAFARRRAAWSAAWLALALLSKELGGVLPALALAWALLVDRDRARSAWRRVAPLAALTLGWAFLHPRLLGRMWGPFAETVESAGRPSPLATAGKTLLALINLEAWPAPVSGAGTVLSYSAIGIAALGALALLAWRSAANERGKARAIGAAPGKRRAHARAVRGAEEAAAPDARAPRPVAFAACWALVGSAPLLLPSIGWHAYYGLFGAFGAWLMFMIALERRPGIALAVVLALAAIRPLRADTPSWDWASDAYQRRAGYFLQLLRDDLLRRHPTMPPHARLYFARVPRNIGLIAGDGPAFRVWYRDTTIRAGYYSYYRPRAEGEPAGPDYFFRFDSVGAWVEVVPGREDVRAARERDPYWEADHRELALLLGTSDDWRAAARELEKLAGAFPDSLEYPLNAAVCYEKLGDSSAAARWYARAAALPAADPRVKDAARHYARHLKPAP
jgi:hypothetical protein